MVLERMNSLKRRFLLGIVHGVGTAIGATIIAAIIIYFLIQGLQAVGADWLLERINIPPLP